MFVGCRHVDEIILSLILDILTDLLQLEVCCLGFIGHISGDKWKGHMDIMEDSVEHCAWVVMGRKLLWC